MCVRYLTTDVFNLSENRCVYVIRQQMCNTRPFRNQVWLWGLPYDLGRAI